MGPVRQNLIQRTVSLFICVCIALCTIVAHNIAQNRPDSFPPYPPDDHHISDDVYLREGGGALKEAVLLRIGFNPTRPTSPCYNPTHACNNTYTKTRMWANAECDGRPAEYRWCPVFNAAVWLTPTTRVPCSNTAKTRNPLKLPQVPQTNETISAASGPKFTILWGHVGVIAA